MVENGSTAHKIFMILSEAIKPVPESRYEKQAFVTAQVLQQRS